MSNFPTRFFQRTLSRSFRTRAEPRFRDCAVIQRREITDVPLLLLVPRNVCDGERAMRYKRATLHGPRLNNCGFSAAVAPHRPRPSPSVMVLYVSKTANGLLHGSLLFRFYFHLYYSCKKIFYTIRHNIQTKTNRQVLQQNFR